MPEQKIRYGVFAKLTKRHPYQEIIPKVDDYEFGQSIEDSDFPEIASHYQLRLLASLSTLTSGTDTINIVSVGGANYGPDASKPWKIKLEKRISTMAGTYYNMQNIIEGINSLVQQLDPPPHSVLLLLTDE